MELSEALSALRKWSDTGPDSTLPRGAAEIVAVALAERAGVGPRRAVGGASYRVEEVTWPVSPFEDGSSSYPHPQPVAALTRGDAVLADIRSDYWDGRARHSVVGAKLGRWRRFRIGSPGESGYDLHLATDEELRAFAREAEEVLAAFGVEA